MQKRQNGKQWRRSSPGVPEQTRTTTASRLRPTTTIQPPTRPTIQPSTRPTTIQPTTRTTIRPTTASANDRHRSEPTPGPAGIQLPIRKGPKRHPSDCSSSEFHLLDSIWGVDWVLGRHCMDPLLYLLRDSRISRRVRILEETEQSRNCYIDPYIRNFCADFGFRAVDTRPCSRDKVRNFSIVASPYYDAGWSRCLCRQYCLAISGQSGHLRVLPKEKTKPVADEIGKRRKLAETNEVCSDILG